jgi:formamidopyrimidine-DNA glycosylase
MPELPDLTIYQRNLKKLLVNRNINEVRVFRAKRLNVSPDKLDAAVRDSKLIDIEREGKELQFRFSSGHSVSVHLMLKGQFDITTDPAAIDHKLMFLAFGPREHLVVSDPKGWATFTLDAKPSPVPDALSTAFNHEYLVEKLKSYAPTTMKAFLIDQEIVRGIGNAYADEILWASRISPYSISTKLPEDAIGKLFNSIKIVLASAIDSISVTAPDAINGEHRDFLNVHNPSRSHSPTGFVIRQEEISTKNTYFTDEQVLY